MAFKIKDLTGVVQELSDLLATLTFNTSSAASSAAQTALDAIATATVALATTISSGNLKTALQTAIPTGANTIGKVDATVLGSLSFQTDTNAAAGTRRTLVSNTATKGIWFANPNTTGTLYVGSTTTVSATVHIWRLLPGQSLFVAGIGNSNLVAWDCDTTGMVINYLPI